MTDSERTTMTILVVNGKFCPNSNGLEVIRYFFFAWDFTTGSELLGVLAGNDSQKVKILKNTCLKGTSLSQSASIELLCVKIGYRLYACQGIKNKINKRHATRIFHPDVEVPSLMRSSPNLAGLLKRVTLSPTQLM